jgi:hypothetical protein
MNGNETSRTTHELDNSDTVGQVANSFRFSGANCGLSGFNGRRKAKGSVNVVDVIVNGLWNTSYRNVNALVWWRKNEFTC